MNKKLRVPAILIFLALIALAAAAWAQDIKSQMNNRLPAIVALKKAGVVGENNQGYLTIRKATDQKALVDAENQDRRTIYASLAKKLNMTPEEVGQSRALHYAEKAYPGTWIQDANGRWRQK